MSGPSADAEWTSDPVDRTGLASYMHLIRAPGDPERRSRKARQDAMGKAQAATHWRTLAKAPVAQWRAAIAELLSNGTPRTFNSISVALCDMTADVAPDNADTALWALVADRVLEHTLETPIYFRTRKE